mmetsp:Transcript_14121/g.26482  ORF Transcript_14121/g.26482 Transcript_14121/m.26482 type:complete len:575 (+) Transcript_14121:705-2429(+)
MASKPNINVIPWKSISALELQYFAAVFNCTFAIPGLLYFPADQISFMLCIVLASFSFGRLLGTPLWLLLATKAKRSAVLVYPSMISGLATAFLGFTTDLATMAALRLASGFFTSVPALLLVSSTKPMLRDFSAGNYEEFPKVTKLTSFVWIFATASALLIGGFLSFSDESGLTTSLIFTELALLLPSLVVAGSIGIIAIIIGNCVGEVERRVVQKPKADTPQAIQGEQKIPNKYVELADTRHSPDAVREDAEPVTERHDNEEEEEEDELPSYLAYGQFEEDSPQSPAGDTPKRFFSPRGSGSTKVESNRPNTTRASQASKIKFVDSSPSMSPQGDTKTTHISYLEEDFESDTPPQFKISLDDIYRRNLSTKITASKPAVHALAMRAITFFVTEAYFYYILIVLRLAVYQDVDSIRVLSAVLIISEVGGFCIASLALPKVLRMFPPWKLWTMGSIGHATLLVLFLPSALYGGTFAVSLILPMLTSCALVVKSMSSLYLYDAVHPCEFDQLEQIDEVTSNIAKTLGCIIGICAAFATAAYSLWPCLCALAIIGCVVPMYLRRVSKYFLRFKNLLEA